MAANKVGMTLQMEEEEEESGWKWLPSDLLLLIFSLLPLSYLIRSALVCKRWRLAAVDAHQDRPNLPFLWSPYTQPDQMYGILDQRFYVLNLPAEFSHSALVNGIYDDWMVDGIYDDWMGILKLPQMPNEDHPMAYFLHNPFSGARIHLPPVAVVDKGWPPIFPQVKFSCNPGETGCLAAYFRGPSEGIGFCRVGSTEASWKIIPCHDQVDYCKITFHKGLIYLVTFTGGLHVADPVSMEIRSVLPPPTMKNLPYWLSYFIWESKSVSLLCHGRFTIFSSDDELLMVCTIRGPRSVLASPIAIYRANFELHMWEILGNFNGRAVLMEEHSLLSLNPNKLFGLEQNCLYFYGHKDPVRMFRVSPQNCATFNLVQNGQEVLQNGQEDDGVEIEEPGEGDDNLDLLQPSWDYVTFYMLTPKPKFFLH